MIRRLSALTILALAACAPGEPPVCAPKNYSCPVIVESDASWREMPDELAPDEVVIEAEFVSGSESAVHIPSSEYYETLFGGATRACSEVMQVSVSQYRVTRVVRGVFNQSSFMAVHGPGGCGPEGTPSGDATAHGRFYAQLKGYDGPLYFIIRPAKPNPGLVAEGQALLRDGPPLMSFRDCCAPPEDPAPLNAPPN